MANDNTGVVVQDDPASAGVTVDSTLENLDASVAAIMDAKDDETADADAISAAQGQPSAAKPDVTEPAADTGIADRFRQDNAKLRNTLIKLGVDPDSDMADSLRNGLISPDEYFRAHNRTQGSLQPATPDSKPSLVQKVNDLRQRLQRSAQVTDADYKQDFNAALEVIGDLVQDRQQSEQQRTMEVALERNVTAAKHVFTSDVKAHIPDDVKATAERLFVDTTYIEANLLGREIGMERAFTPQGYEHVARKLAPQFDEFVNAVFKAGAQAQLEAFKRGNKNIVVPLSAGRGASPPPLTVPKDHYALENMERNVERELVNKQFRV